MKHDINQIVTKLCYKFLYSDINNLPKSRDIELAKDSIQHVIAKMVIGEILV